MTSPQEERGPDPDPEPMPPRLVTVWPYVRTALQLGELLTPGTHEGLRLATQALVVTGDLVVCILGRDKHH